MSREKAPELVRRDSCGVEIPQSQRESSKRQTNKRKMSQHEALFCFRRGGVTVMDFRFAATSVSCLTKLYAGKEVRPAYSLHLYVDCLFFKKILTGHVA